MSKVYVLTSGEYEDVVIRGVFSGKEKCESAAKLIGGYVEEFELDGFITQVPPKNLKFYGVWIRSGTKTRCDEYSPLYHDGTIHKSSYSGLNSSSFSCCIYAASKEEAIATAEGLCDAVEAGSAPSHRIWRQYEQTTGPV